jgi:phytol kinase
MINSLLTRFLPEPRLAALLFPFLTLYSIGAAYAVGSIKRRYCIKTAYTRKIFHFCIFSLAGVLHIIFGSGVVSLFGAITVGVVLYGVYRGAGCSFYDAIARPKDAPRESFFVLVPLFTTALGGIGSVLLFPQFAYIGYFAGGWGDAIGEPAGALWGKHPYKVSSPLGVQANRTIEGSAAVLLISVFVAALALLASGYSGMQVVITALAVGCGAALVEAVSTHGFDNLTIQIAASGIAWLLLR